VTGEDRRSTVRAMTPPPDLGGALERFGFRALHPGQKQVVDALLSGANALAVFPTGGGKSLCYQLPALLIDGLTVVVSPLIALMKDQIDFLAGRGIAAARLDSSLTFEETKRAQDGLRSGKIKLLYVAPERFGNERFVAMLKEIPIGLFAIDEAHCISEWGHNFRPDYLKLAETARSLGAARILALTATATPSVVEDIRKAFEIRPEHAVVTGFHRPNLEIWTTPVAEKERETLLLERLRSPDRKPGPSIVYVTLQRTAVEVAKALATAGFPAHAYHAGMEAEARASVQDEWMRSDRGIVVATIAFGMGIDKSNVRYVYHYNLPKSLESYSQEIGRAGRDGERSIVELFVCPTDIPVLENFAYGDTPSESALRAVTETVLSAPEIELSLYSLGQEHDLRPLVLRTALTYLELAKAVRQLTPRYAGYETRLHRPFDEILSELPPEPARFLEQLFSPRITKKGRIWYAVDPEKAAAALDQPRERVVRSLEYLEGKGWAEIRPSDLRHRFVRLAPPEQAPALVDELARRFSKREVADMERVQQVLDLVTASGCQSAALVAHFGERLASDCGHCTFCRTKQAQVLLLTPPVPPLPAGFDAKAFQTLRPSHAAALAHPRQAARFLCGLTSPATTQAKLSRHALFGVLEARRFSEVLAWCTSTA
jgi:ATP-dependent DNA helicase RecQ